MSNDDPLKPWRDMMASGKVVMSHVIDMPIKLSLSEAGVLQIDSPFAVVGIEQAGLQRMYIMATLETLLVALQELADHPDRTIEIKAGRAAN
ncbi:hypothetical protein [Labrys monachus]|uniref:Uncharacterized protein n=1 Tax=Labrys monachus TaxID=217067 RepID=A0ABU0FL11_9HYPH|nr:hypothetical protein [Labrys monachus]MDQ0395176.1 hypothetical protein [Labrys monachus]